MRYLHSILALFILVTSLLIGPALQGTAAPVVLRDALSGITVSLPSNWAIVSSEEMSPIAKLLAESYDPDHSLGLYKKVQGAVYYGTKASEFRQITIMPLLYQDMKFDEPTMIKLQDRTNATYEQHRVALEQSIASAGTKVLKSGLLVNGCFVTGNVNNTVLQDVHMRYTQRGLVLIMYFAGGTDKAAEYALKKLPSYVTISMRNLPPLPGESEVRIKPAAPVRSVPTPPQ